MIVKCNNCNKGFQFSRKPNQEQLALTCTGCRVGTLHPVYFYSNCEPSLLELPENFKLANVAYHNLAAPDLVNIFRDSAFGLWIFDYWQRQFYTYKLKFQP